ncbi:MAG TPA: cystatin domain-containing protein [Pyrinomonadaceae bacterium]
MKKSSLMLFIALGVFLSYGIVAQAQGRPKMGGYKEVEKNDDGSYSSEVQEAAEFAVKAEAEKEETQVKLVSVEHAETQVVAGVNYKLCLKVEVEDKENNTDATVEVQVVVYRNLQKAYSLTSWEQADCDEGKDDKDD